MNEISTYCEYFYNCSLIPSYLYRNDELVESFPKQESYDIPHNISTDMLQRFPSQVSCITTKQHSHFGCIHLTNSPYSIIIGPVSNIPYPKEAIQFMGQDYFVYDDFDSFAEFIKNIPIMSIDTFLHTVLFINFTLNKTKLRKENIVFYNKDPLNSTIQETFFAKNYDEKEDEILINNYKVESELLRYIETGNIDGLRQFTERSKQVDIRSLSGDGIRHLQNICLVTITLASRAAMKGGLPPTTAYLLTNIYTNQADSMKSPEELLALTTLVQEDFCTRTAAVHSNLTNDNMLNKAIEYVRLNTNRNITVYNVAEHVGFSYAYISKKFKKELGFNLSNFIRRCKLEESRELLTFTNKSISQISNYLCFSSQSHFQRAFKEQYHVTPQNYRKSNTTM